MTTEHTSTDGAAQPLGVGSSEGLGAGAEARGCDNCGKRGPWQTENGAGKNKAMTYELAECHPYPKPAWWKNAGPLWVARGCGSECKVWAPMEAPNAAGNRLDPVLRGKSG
jgi:hypothetical protein